MANFQDNLGKPVPGCIQSGFLSELSMMEVVVTAGAVRLAKLQSSSYHQETNTQHFTYWMHFISPNQQCQSTEWRKRYR